MKKRRFKQNKTTYTYIPSETVNKRDISQIMRYTRAFKCGYVSTAFSFDIETTSYYSATHNRELATMYTWQIGLEEETITGRTWDEFKRILNLISDEVPEGSLILCWVHNLSFEWQWIKKQLTWNMKKDYPDIFAKTTRDIIYARCGRVEFRDSAALTGMPLKAFQKNYGLSIGKLQGDLDYKLVRHSGTPLTNKEIAYCINDVQVLNEWHRKYILPYYLELDKPIPLTSTGIVRSEIKEAFNALPKEEKRKLRNRLKNAQPSYNMYLHQRFYLFRGGLVHANAVQCNETFDSSDTAGLDLKSAHPSYMLLELFPWKFNRINERLFPEALTQARNREYAFFGDFEFYNIRCKGWHVLESRNKIIESVGAVYENGRIVTAEYIKVCLTELDYFNYEDTYSWDKCECIMLYQARLEPLPDYIRRTILKYFELKEKSRGDALNYALSKAKLNSIFGMFATSINEEEIVYDPEKNELVPSGEKKDYDSLVRYQVMLPTWAIWTAAYTRRSILRSVMACGPGGIDSIYYDTDSNKVKNYSKHKAWFDSFNNEMKEKIAKMEVYDFDREHFKDLGQFQLEMYPLKRYKVLGCKRYMVTFDETDKETGEVKEITQVTVAGMVKGTLENYANNEYDFQKAEFVPRKKPLDMWELFTDDLTLNPPYSDKQTTVYTDSAFTDEITDYKGVKAEIKEGSCVAIIDIPFSMNVEKEFIERIEALRFERQYSIYKGVL